MDNARHQLNKHQHIFLIIAAFLVIYAFSLTFVYVEGDDASIVAYHLLGRDDSLRSKYAIYQAMFGISDSSFPQLIKLPKELIIY